MNSKLKTAFLSLLFFGFCVTDSYVMAKTVEISRYSSVTGDFDQNTGVLNIGNEDDYIKYLSQIDFDGCKDVKVVNIRNVESIPTEFFKNCINLDTINIYVGRGEMNIREHAFKSCPVRELNFIHEDYIGSYCYDYENYLPFTEFVTLESAGLVFNNLQTLTFNGPWSFNHLSGLKMSWYHYAPFNIGNGYKDTPGKITVYCNDKRASTLFFADDACILKTMRDLYDLRNPIFSSASLNDTPVNADGSLVIPNKYTRIDSSAFVNSRDTLKNVKIPNGVSEINHHLFENCKKLETVEIPTSVKDIWSGVFLGCDQLKSITLPTNVKTIREATFFGCSKLEGIKIHEGVERIEDFAFCGCIGLSEVYIPASVKSIGRSVFAFCRPDLNVYTYNEKIQAQLAIEGINAKLISK